MLADSIHTIYENTMQIRAKASWDRDKTLSKDQKRDFGYIFFSPDKESFQYGVCLRSYATLDYYSGKVEFIHRDPLDAPFITFNSFAFFGKKTADTLRFLNAVSIEVDNPEATMADVCHLCDMYDLPYPNLVIKSPNGIHLHWLIKRVRAFRPAMEAYQLISEALKKTFAWILADATGPERYWRMPTNQNTLRFIDEKYTLDELKAWAMECLGQNDMASFSASPKVQGRPVVKGILEDAAIKELLNGVPYDHDIRNYACYTLALIMASSTSMSDEEILSYLKETWNPKNERPIAFPELKRTVRSAIRGVRSGRIKGAKEKWINHILKVMGSNKRFRYVKRSKYTGETTYTKRSELMQQIIRHIEAQGGSLFTSQRRLAQELGACFKSVQMTLQQMSEEGIADITTVKGRNGGTEIRLRADVQEVNYLQEAAAAAEVVPMPSNAPEAEVKHIIAATPERVSIGDLQQKSSLEPNVFLHTLMSLLNRGAVRMLEPARDGTARFTLGPPAVK
ncbi:hypothetical protein [Brevibacillus agri]|uniref:hypothetical protein n=1 Tax=Brevibacillus agri TaxID=51101 RepID=UPI0018CE1033|nr:hypothetical protein [Brevibacillus agri]MBG9568424.1 hypothetical protein [Brevibacillus agri]